MSSSEIDMCNMFYSILYHVIHAHKGKENRTDLSLIFLASY
jgi:hypothetical protein